MQHHPAGDAPKTEDAAYNAVLLLASAGAHREAVGRGLSRGFARRELPQARIEGSREELRFRLGPHHEPLSCMPPQMLYGTAMS